MNNSWFFIANAPRDGTQILCYWKDDDQLPDCPEHMFSIAVWVDGELDGQRDRESGCWCEPETVAELTPTHWMPLPEPPP